MRYLTLMSQYLSIMRSKAKRKAQISMDRFQEENDTSYSTDARGGGIPRETGHFCCHCEFQDIVT